jgi:hypothetical protein
MPKNNKEKATDAWSNPPHPGDPTSDVTRQDHASGGSGSSGEPLHKPPMKGAEYDAEQGVWLSPGDIENREKEQARERGEQDNDGSGEPVPYSKDTGAAVPSSTGRDANHDGRGGPAVSEVDSDEYRDDPMPTGADAVVEWAERGKDGPARANAALHAEHNRPGGSRVTVIRRLEQLRDERRNTVIREDDGQ